MADYNELDVTINRLDSEAFQVSLELVESGPNRGTVQGVPPAKITIAFDNLRTLLHDYNFTEYGQALRDAVFKPAAIHALFVRATGLKPLRIRLKLDPAEPRLHSLRWSAVWALQGMIESTSQAQLDKIVRKARRWDQQDLSAGAVNELTIRKVQTLSATADTE